MAIFDNEKGTIELQRVGMFDVNCYLVYIKDSKNLYIIDSGADARHIIRKAKLFNTNNIFLIQTHCHVDHISALTEVKRELNAKKIYVHPSEMALYNSPNNFFLPYYHPVKDLPAPNKGYSPTECEVIETPGHTKGGVCFYFKQISALFTGDTLFQESIGRTDLNGGDYTTLIKSIKQKILPLPEDTTIYPGHGATSSIANEKKYNPYL